MANTGTVSTNRVNATKYEVFIATVSNEWLLLQDARLVLSHAENPESTTAGGVVLYSGLPRNSLSGTILYTTDQWGAAIAGWTALSTRTNGEYPIFTLVVRFTGADGSTNTLTFTNGAKLQEFSFPKGTEGATKCSVNIAIAVDPTVS